MLLIIDNYDSFTYNLVQYFQCLKQEVVVYAHDQIRFEAIKQLAPSLSSYFTQAPKVLRMQEFLMQSYRCIYI